MNSFIAVLLSLSIFASYVTTSNADISISGELGSFSNPVQCDGPRGEKGYLNRLFGPNGEPIRYSRLWSCGGGPYGNRLDCYKVTYASMKTTIFMDMHHPGYVETNNVPGFIIVNIVDGIPAKILSNKAAHIDILKNAIRSVGFLDSGEALASKIENLVSLGIDVNVCDAEGNTPLLLVAHKFYHPFPVLKVLLDAGADVNAKNIDGDTALHVLLRKYVYDTNAVRLLIDAGISVTATNKMGDTAFLYVYRPLDHEDDEEEMNEDTHNRLIAARLLLDAGAGEWKDYMDTPITVIPDPPNRINPVVAKLLDPTQRDDAFRKILSWQKYRSKPYSLSRIFKPLRYVVVCPQEKGPPIYAVFPWGNYEQRAIPKGHVILIDADGAIIPYYQCANSLDDASEFRDINGDGIIDEISTIGYSRADVLHVLPVTRNQTPTLNIVLKRKGFSDTEWSWRVTKTAEPDVFSIELGPLAHGTDQIIPKVQYKWSKEENRYVGPAGGGQLPFMRLNTADPCGSAEYDEFVSTQEEEGGR